MALAFLWLHRVQCDLELWRRLGSLERVFPMETEDTDQGRFEDRFHGAPLELSDCEDSSSEAMEEVVLEPPETRQRPSLRAKFCVLRWRRMTPSFCLPRRRSSRF